MASGKGVTLGSSRALASGVFADAGGMALVALGSLRLEAGVSRAADTSSTLNSPVWEVKPVASGACLTVVF